MFHSTFCYRGNIELPTFTGMRVMMMPLRLGELDTVPETLDHYRDTLAALFNMAGHRGEVGYLTIDEKHLDAGQCTRRGGVHVDGVFEGRIGAWGGGGGWGSVGNGMLTVSSHPGCRAWLQPVDGIPGPDGECDHLVDQLHDENARTFGANEVYWLDGLAVHESLPVTEAVDRQFVRLSLPSNGPWFEGYTENPLGVVPTGPILPRRSYMTKR